MFDLYGLQTPQCCPHATLYSSHWLLMIQNKDRHIFSLFYSSPQSARNCHLMYCKSEPTATPPHILCSSLLPPGSDTSVMTNHQLSPWWWWRCCQGNRHPGQQAPVATWEMMMSENEVPGVCRLGGGGERWWRHIIRWGQVWPLHITTDLTLDPDPSSH